MPKISLRQAEFFFLLALAFFLPALEAPKNICVVLYLLCWLLNRWRSGDWGGRWSGWDSLVAALIASAYASAVFAGLPIKGLSGGNDVLVYGLVLLALRRSRFSTQQLCWILGTLVVATLLTLLYGYWGLLVTKERGTLGLHSVGHVNHSAIYIAIVFALALAWASATQLQGKPRILIWVATVFLFVSLMMTAARGALIPGVIFAAVWLFLIARQRAIRLWKPLLLMVVVVGVGGLLQPGIVGKTIENFEGGHAGSFRPSLARVAMLAAREYPVFGVGISNFNKISEERVREWQEQHGRLFADSDLYFSAHAHNLYFNTLAERGLVGLAALLALLGTMGVALWRARPGKDDASMELVLWGGALGAWGVIVLGGLFNTTLHHENALLSAILFGIWLASRNVLQENPSS